MRTFFVVLIALICIPAFGQQERREVSVFLSVQPDLFVTVWKHKLGPDMVDLVVKSQNYPPELLSSQIQELGRLLKSEPRGLRMEPHIPNAKQPDQVSWRALFAVDGVIDRENGLVRIEPFLKAFAGAPEPHTIHGISLVLDGEKPTERTIRRYAASSVRAEAITSTSPLSIEYRIELLSQNPREITFPEAYEKPAQAPAPPPAPDRRWLILGLFAAAAIAGGALVYLALLRGAPQAQSKPNK